MKITRNVSKVLAVLALGALGVAAPQASGGASGRWVQVSPRTTTIEALMFQGGDGGSRYHLSAILIGNDRGHIYGDMEQLAQPGEVDPPGGELVHLEYVLTGDYIDMGDGRLYIRSQISLDTRLFGGTELVPVGVFDGQVLGWDQNLGYCPGPIGPVQPATDPDLHPVGPNEPSGPGLIDEQPTDPQLLPLGPVERSGRFVARWYFF